MDYEATAKLIEALARAGVATFTTADFSVTFPPKAEPMPIHVPQMAVPNLPAIPEGSMQAISHANLQTNLQTKAPEPGTAGAAPPVDIEIPHQVNQVRSLLRLSDYELAERLFPDFTQPLPAAAKEA